jgi:hypothetical protein
MKCYMTGLRILERHVAGEQGRITVFGYEVFSPRAHVQAGFRCGSLGMWLGHENSAFISGLIH